MNVPTILLMSFLTKPWHWGRDEVMFCAPLLVMGRLLLDSFVPVVTMVSAIVAALKMKLTSGLIGFGIFALSWFMYGYGFAVSLGLATCLSLYIQIYKNLQNPRHWWQT